jgi:hypothetical protein
MIQDFYYTITVVMPSFLILNRISTFLLISLIFLTTF